jgi:hypothetical protein
MRDSCRSSVLTRSEGDRVRVHTVLIRLAPLRDHAVAIRASGREHLLGWRSASQRLGLASCRTMRQGLVLSSERGFLAGWWRCVYSPNFGAFAKVCESSRRLASGVKRIGRQRAYEVSSASWMILRSNLVGVRCFYSAVFTDSCSRQEPAKVGALAPARSVLPDSQGDSQEGGSMRTRTDEPGLTGLTIDRDRTLVDMRGR